MFWLMKNIPLPPFMFYIMCGCFGNTCTCIQCVLYCLYCVFVLFRLCIFYSYLFCLYWCKNYQPPSENSIVVTNNSNNLTVRGPCILIYSYNTRQRDALFLKFILVKNSTCFRQIYSPSSGVSTLYTQQQVFVILVMWDTAGLRNDSRSKAHMFLFISSVIQLLRVVA